MNDPIGIDTMPRTCSGDLRKRVIEAAAAKKLDQAKPLKELSAALAPRERRPHRRTEHGPGRTSPDWRLRSAKAFSWFPMCPLLSASRAIEGATNLLAGQIRGGSRYWILASRTVPESG
jgi:hypothetical protein